MYHVLFLLGILMNKISLIMNILVFCVENKILPVADNKLWWCSYSAEAQQSVREKWKPDFLGKKRTSKPLTEEMAFSAPKSLMFLQTPQSWRFCAIHFHDTACGFLMELNIQWQPPVCKNQCHFVASLFYFQYVTSSCAYLTIMLKIFLFSFCIFFCINGTHVLLKLWFTTAGLVFMNGF